MAYDGIDIKSSSMFNDDIDVTIQKLDELKKQLLSVDKVSRVASNSSYKAISRWHDMSNKMVQMAAGNLVRPMTAPAANSFPSARTQNNFIEKTYVQRFETSGIERYKDELGSVDMWLNKIRDTSEYLKNSANIFASDFGIIKPETADEMNNVLGFIERIQSEASRLSELTQQISLGNLNPEDAIGRIESLREMTSRAEQQMSRMRAGMDDLNVGKMNTAFNSLKDQASKIEMFIRDKMSGIKASVQEDFTPDVNLDGMQRYNAMVSYSSQLVSDLISNQRNLNQTISAMPGISDNVRLDVINLNNELTKVKNSVSMISSRKPNIPFKVSGVQYANNQMDLLNQKIKEVLSLQDLMNENLNKGDMSSAVTQYDAIKTKLNDINGILNRNVSAQNQFKSSISESVNALSSLSSSGPLTNLISSTLTVAGAKKGFDSSDTYVSQKARIANITDGSDTSIAEFLGKTYGSANDSRALYTDMLTSTTKMGMLASDAFNSVDELIKFNEYMNKSFVLGGSGSREQAMGMYQLTQAMASGRLQGDEYRSIIENAPLFAKAIQDLVQPILDKQGMVMKDLTSQGLITPDIMKAAIFSVADEIDAKMATIPKRFSDIVNEITNYASLRSEVLKQTLNDTINSPSGEMLNLQAKTVVDEMVDFGNRAIPVVVNLFGAFQRNWGWIKPMTVGIVTFKLFTSTVLGVDKRVQDVVKAFGILDDAFPWVRIGVDKFRGNVLGTGADSTKAAVGVGNLNSGLTTMQTRVFTLAAALTVVGVAISLIKNKADEAREAAEKYGIKSSAELLGVDEARKRYEMSISSTTSAMPYDPTKDWAWSTSAAQVKNGSLSEVDTLASIMANYKPVSYYEILGLNPDLTQEAQNQINKTMDITYDLISRLGEQAKVQETYKASGSEMFNQKLLTETNNTLEYLKSMTSRVGDLAGLNMLADTKFKLGEGAFKNLYKSMEPFLSEEAKLGMDQNALGLNPYETDYTNYMQDIESYLADMLDALDKGEREEDLVYLREYAAQKAIDRNILSNITVNISDTNHISNDVDLDGYEDRTANKIIEAISEAVGNGAKGISW